MTTWYTSKTLWLNAIAVITLLLQAQFGFVIDPETQTGLLAVVNLILRAITKTPLTWTTPGTPPADGGYIRLPALGFILVFFACVLAMSGCATTATTPPAATSHGTTMQTAGKSLLTVKSSLVAAAVATDALCKTGTLKSDICAQAKSAYEVAKPAYDTAVDTYLLMSTGGGDPAAFGAALIRVQNLTAHLLQLSGGAK